VVIVVVLTGVRSRHGVSRKTAGRRSVGIAIRVVATILRRVQSVLALNLVSSLGQQRNVARAVDVGLRQREG